MRGIYSCMLCGVSCRCSIFISKKRQVCMVWRTQDQYLSTPLRYFRRISLGTFSYYGCPFSVLVWCFFFFFLNRWLRASYQLFNLNFSEKWAYDSLRWSVRWVRLIEHVQFMPTVPKYVILEWARFLEIINAKFLGLLFEAGVLGLGLFGLLLPMFVLEQKGITVTLLRVRVENKGMNWIELKAFGYCVDQFSFW